MLWICPIPEPGSQRLYCISSRLDCKESSSAAQNHHLVLPQPPAPGRTRARHTQVLLLMFRGVTAAQPQSRKSLLPLRWPRNGQFKGYNWIACVQWDHLPQNHHVPNKLENKWIKSPNTSVFKCGSSHFLPEDTYIASLFPCEKFSISKLKTITEDTHLNDFWPLKENLSRKILHDDVLQ